MLRHRANPDSRKRRPERTHTYQASTGLEVDSISRRDIWGMTRVKNGNRDLSFRLDPLRDTGGTVTSREEGRR